jgi:hypothetical protein
MNTRARFRTTIGARGGGDRFYPVPDNLSISAIQARDSLHRKTWAEIGRHGPTRARS